MSYREGKIQGELQEGKNQSLIRIWGHEVSLVAWG